MIPPVIVKFGASRNLQVLGLLIYGSLSAPWLLSAESTRPLVPSDIVSRLDELEIASIDLNITIALDTLADSGSQDWSSSSNQAQGHITVLRSFEFDSVRCREIQIVSKQAGASDQRTISFCQNDELAWRPLTFRLADSH